jgi:hypothetical protein
MTEDILVYAAQTAFPAAIATYLLVRMEKTLQELTHAINDLRSVVGARR